MSSKEQEEVSYSSDEEEDENKVSSDVEEEEEEEQEEDDVSIPENNSEKDDDNMDEDEDEILENNGNFIPQMSDTEEDDEDDDEMNETYLQKFNAEVNNNYIVDFHPECTINNYDEISTLTKVVRDKNNNIIDKIHRTIPFLTKYERTRILGQRAKQINSGAKAFVKVPENVIDGYLIAELELSQKRLPFIIRRPLPGGGCEYWNVKDLEIISF